MFLSSGTIPVCVLRLYMVFISYSEYLHWSSAKCNRPLEQLSPFTCKIEHEIVQIYLSLNSIKIASNIQSKNIYQVVQKYRLLLYKQLG